MLCVGVCVYFESNLHEIFDPTLNKFEEINNEIINILIPQVLTNDSKKHLSGVDALVDTWQIHHSLNSDQNNTTQQGIVFL